MFSFCVKTAVYAHGYGVYQVVWEHRLGGVLVALCKNCNDHVYHNEEPGAVVLESSSLEKLILFLHFGVLSTKFSIFV